MIALAYLATITISIMVLAVTLLRFYPDDPFSGAGPRPDRVAVRR